MSDHNSFREPTSKGRTIIIGLSLLFLLVSTGLVFIYVNQQSSLNDIRNRAAPLYAPTAMDTPPAIVTPKSDGSCPAGYTLNYDIPSIKTCRLNPTTTITTAPTTASTCTSAGGFPTSGKPCCSGLGSVTAGGGICGVAGSRCPNGEPTEDGDLCNCTTKPAACSASPTTTITITTAPGACAGYRCTDCLGKTVCNTNTSLTCDQYRTLNGNCGSGSPPPFGNNLPGGVCGSVTCSKNQACDPGTMTCKPVSGTGNCSANLGNCYVTTKIGATLDGGAVCDGAHWTTCSPGYECKNSDCVPSSNNPPPPPPTSYSYGQGNYISYSYGQGSYTNPTNTPTPTLPPGVTATPTPTLPPGVTPTNTSTPTPTPSPLPTPPPLCDSTCASDTSCPSGMICSSGRCRNSQCTEKSNCLCNVPTPTPTLPPQIALSGCNYGCTVNADCSSALVCIEGFCRNPSCTEKTTCQCDIAAGPTPKTPVAGTGPSVMGAAIIGSAFLLILLGLAL